MIDRASRYFETFLQKDRICKSEVSVRSFFIYLIFWFAFLKSALNFKFIAENVKLFIYFFFGSLNKIYANFMQLYSDFFKVVNYLNIWNYVKWTYYSVSIHGWGLSAKIEHTRAWFRPHWSLDKAHSSLDWAHSSLNLAHSSLCRVHVSLDKAHSFLTQAWIGLTLAWIGLTRAWIGLTRAWIGLTRAWIGLTRAWIGLTRARMGLTRAWIGLTRAWIG